MEVREVERERETGLVKREKRRKVEDVETYLWTQVGTALRSTGLVLGGIKWRIVDLWWRGVHAGWADVDRDDVVSYRTILSNAWVRYNIRLDEQSVLAEVLCLHRGVVKKEVAVLCRRKEEGSLPSPRSGEKGSVAVLCRRKEEGSLPSPRSGEKGSVAVLCRRKEEGSLPSPRSGEKGSVAVLCRRKLANCTGMLYLPNVRKVVASIPGVPGISPSLKKAIKCGNSDRARARAGGCRQPRASSRAAAGRRGQPQACTRASAGSIVSSFETGFRVDPATRRVNLNPTRFSNGSNPGIQTRPILKSELSSLEAFVYPVPASVLVSEQVRIS
ncbi:hypothetical protein M5K25_026211 [Dendrobium thyrsiflorum]|uniref:Uncharacterized protein n=1 Tax=Dendrobium thyrsiflorum TaxID=117978 RepID=A0ABD0TX25_DENTH